MYRRFLFLLVASTLITLVLIIRSGNNIRSTKIWRNAPQMIGLGELIDEEPEEQTAPNPPSSLPPPRLPEDPSDEEEPQPIYHYGTTNKSSLIGALFRPDEYKPRSNNFTKAVVLGRLSSENTTWLDDTDLPPHISKYIYITDRNPSSASSQESTTLLKLPKNKGHEAMVYLTYIIDHYETLADVSIFLHAHQHAWHNNELLNHDAVEMIRRLSAERVIREGYMNLRCHWKPGCPEYIHPGVIRADKDKLEEGAMAAAWAVLFPGEQIPEIIASSCCAQFAVSRAAINNIPLSKYKQYRDWLLRTELDDYISGRVFEYLWHKIFTGYSVYCPNMRLCYCDGYGVCFHGDEDFDYWFQLKFKKRQAEKKLDEWRTLVANLEREEAKFRFGRKGFEGLEEQDLQIPAVDGDVVLQKEIDELRVVLEEQRLVAIKAGTDPRVRALVAGRPWHPGDGF